MAATKLLGNDDRWADRSVHCQDLINLAMLDAGSAALDTAADKVRGPYPSANRSLNRAIDHVREDPSPLPKYMRELDMSSAFRGEVVSKFEELRRAR